MDKALQAARTVDVHFHVGAPNELWGAPLPPLNVDDTRMLAPPCLTDWVSGPDTSGASGALGSCARGPTSLRAGWRVVLIRYPRMKE